MKTFQSNLHPFLKLLFFTGIALTSAIIFYAIGILFANIFLNISSEMIRYELQNFDNIGLVKFFQFISQLGLFILPPFIFYYLMEREIVKPLHLNILPNKRSFVIVFILIFAILPIINLLSLWNQSIQFPESLQHFYERMVLDEERMKVLTDKMLSGTSITDLFSNLFIIAIIPAIGEELFFRGVIQKLLIKWFGNAHVAILVTSILFSALHMQFFGFLPRLLLGMMFGYFFYWSKSIWLSIFAHFINNASAVLVAFYIYKNNIDISYEEFGGYNNNAIVIIASLLLCLILMFQLYKIEKKKCYKEIS